MPPASSTPPQPKTLGSIRNRIFFMRQREVGMYGTTSYWIQVHEAHKERVDWLSDWMPTASKVVGGLGIIGILLAVFGIGFLSEAQGIASAIVFLFSGVLRRTHFRYFRPAEAHAGSSAKADAKVTKDASMKASVGGSASVSVEVDDSNQADSDSENSESDR